MPDLKISDLATKTSVSGTDLVPIVDESGTPTTKKVTVSKLDARYIALAIALG